MDTQKASKLRRIVATPAGEKPRFEWKRLIKKRGNRVNVDCDVNEIADKIGCALIDSYLLNGRSDFFSEENKQLVVSLVEQVCNRILSCADHPISQAAIDDFIEEILVKDRRVDMAQAFVVKKNFANDYYFKLGNEKKLNLIRRDGSIVPWNIEKIKRAVELAFEGQNKSTDRAEKISRAVTKRILNEGLSFIHIENVQDCVQEELMRQGEYKVAEAYILYRAEHAKARDSGDIEESKSTKCEYDEQMLLVKDSDGKSYFWNGAELKRLINYANDGLETHLTFDEIFFSLKKDIPTDVDKSELKKCIIQNARKLIEKDPTLALFAARIQLLYTYEDVLGWNCEYDSFDDIDKKQSAAFIKYIKTSVESGLLHKDMLKYDVEKLASALRSEYDKGFDAIAIQSMEEHYFMRDANNKVLETPQMLWMRVAMGVFLAKDDAEDDVLELYEVMRDRKFCLATPTLYYAGTVKPQMMSSYIYEVEDDMNSIMTRGISDNAFIAKWGGGIAGSWSNVRCRGSRISGTRGEAPGVIPFLQLHQHQLAIANQGIERRRGRGAAYLEIWHNDIMEFIDYKKEHSMPGMQNDALGTVVWVPDLFMQRLENDDNWTLFNTEDAYCLHDLYGDDFNKKYRDLEKLVNDGGMHGKSVSSREIWQKIMQRIFESGYPKIAFKDTCNRANMCKSGVIHSLGLCLEHVMNTTSDETAVCNTGALDIHKHLNDDGDLDKASLHRTISIATRALDAMIDVNFFPSDASRVFAQKYRAIGLGLMGLQNAFYVKNIPFGSDEAIEFGEDCVEILTYETISESCTLAEKYGPCAEFDKSEWKKGILPIDLSNEKSSGKLDWESLRERVRNHGVRNAYMNACSPTRKIARLLGCYPELSPATKNVFTKRFSDNYEMMIISPDLVERLKKAGVWNKSVHKQIRYFEGELAAIDEIPEDIKNVFLTAYMISSDAIIEGAARRQKWLDQSQSLRLFLGSPNLCELSSMFISAWQKGIKGVYDVKSAGFFSLPKEMCSYDKNLDQTSVIMDVLAKFHDGSM